MATYPTARRGDDKRKNARIGTAARDGLRHLILSPTLKISCECAALVQKQVFELEIHDCIKHDIIIIIDETSDLLLASLPRSIDNSVVRLFRIIGHS